jgi:phage shock protein PspC (stress-responsive transcriptional regulator)
MDENSIVCVKCGFDPMSEKKFCYKCGVETNERQIICVKCGVGFQNLQKKSTTKSSRPVGYEGFYRSSDEKLFLGVCGGLSHKFGLQLGLVRFLVFVSLFFFIGWLYFGGLFIPKLPTKNV